MSLSHCDICGEAWTTHRTACNREGSFAASPCYPPAIASEFLIGCWEAKAKAYEQAAEDVRGTMIGLVAMNLERARAYRECVKDLRRHTETTNKRQPEDNDSISDRRKEMPDVR